MKFGYGKQALVAALIVATLFALQPFRVWFALKPVDVMFTFGGTAFGIGGLKGILNKQTRVDRWSSGPTAVVLTTYLVAYWSLGTYFSLLSGTWGAFNWWFLFFRRYVGMKESSA